MLAKLPTLAVASIALWVAACPAESDAASPSGAGSSTGVEAGAADEIDAAAKQAADKIDEANADEELEKLKQELDQDE